MVRFKVTVLLLLVCGGMTAQERNKSADSVAIDFFQAIGSFAALYYGHEYEEYPQTTNHPYLIDEKYTNARLSYGKTIYPEVLLRLDLYRNELLVRSGAGYRNIVLFPENVEFAEMHGKHVVYFQKDDLPGCPASGYYILLYSGKYKVLEKISAQLIEKTESGKLERYFQFSTRFYLLKDGVYHPVKSKRGLLKALSPYGKELKKFISTRKLNYKKGTEDFLILTLGEYERLMGVEN
ncbi:MAG: hypothetical protein LBE91_17145 [Tannerella sp.]|jgi:hypothetical protein|nr:hypothetical protein [Tannerella sp.]